MNIYRYKHLKNIFFINKKSYFNNTKSILKDNSFKEGELITCKIYNDVDSVKKKNSEYYTCRLFKLEKNSIFKTNTIEIFHEHIISKTKSMKNQQGLVKFKLGSTEVYFKRANLYEYIVLKEQSAVSSQYSVMSLVPMLLELDKGSRVLECGTGSGSMTLHLSKHLGENGLIYTMDLTDEKVNRAKMIYQKWKDSYDLNALESEKWPSNVYFNKMDFCNEQLDPELNGTFDAVYLDMAHIYKVLEKVYELLRFDGVLVINAMHLTQILKCLNTIERKGIGLEKEIVLEPSNRTWDLRRISDPDQINESLNWTCRLEDRFVEKFKRGGLFFNYWQGYLVKFRKIR